MSGVSCDWFLFKETKSGEGAQQMMVYHKWIARSSSTTTPEYRNRDMNISDHVNTNQIRIISNEMHLN